jgi:hypothetical protein
VSGLHRGPAPTDLPCPVCRTEADRPCRAVDFLPLPGVHGERVEATPLFDELAGAVS